MFDDQSFDHWQVPESDEAVCDALARELERGGQVLFAPVYTFIDLFT